MVEQSIDDNTQIAASIEASPSKSYRCITTKLSAKGATGKISVLSFKISSESLSEASGEQKFGKYLKSSSSSSSTATIIK
jgi:hypothetical protein